MTQIAEGALKLLLEQEGSFSNIFWGRTVGILDFCDHHWGLALHPRGLLLIPAVLGDLLVTILYVLRLSHHSAYPWWGCKRV